MPRIMPSRAETKALELSTKNNGRSVLVIPFIDRFLNYRAVLFNVLGS